MRICLKIPELIFEHYFTITWPQNIGHQAYFLIKWNFLLLGVNYAILFTLTMVNLNNVLV